MLIAQHVDEFRIVHRHDSLESFTTAEMAADVGIGNCDFFDVVAVDFFQEPAKGKDLLSSGRGVLHDLIQQYGRRQNQDPEQNRFCCRIQLKPPTASVKASPSRARALRRRCVA